VLARRVWLEEGSKHNMLGRLIFLSQRFTVTSVIQTQLKREKSQENGSTISFGEEKCQKSTWALKNLRLTVALEVTIYWTLLGSKT
jgi:hypothetical protein